MEQAYLHRQWTFTAGVKNIGDATYFLAANGGVGLVGDPRTFFLSISLRD
jgi:outer membrane receptor protein involved in Fe transport